MRDGRLLSFLLCFLLTGPLPARPDATAKTEVFIDRTAASGLDFVHFNGMSGRYYFSEITGAGGALFDYDNDGDLDLYLVQGRMLGPDSELSKALVAPKHPLPLKDRLYRNDLKVVGGVAQIKFTDVTEESRLAAHAYGMGAATGDYNNDGWVDLYVTNFAASNQLWHNNGDGTFADVTATAGVGEERWSVAATFFDYDLDGFLDLFVANYVDFTLARNKACLKENSLRDYCGPQSYKTEPDRLFRNRGDGTFEDVSKKVGIADATGAGLGAIAADLDGNGWPDLYVANDMSPNRLWLNQGQQGFLDDALLLGCAVNREGQPEASMGVDAGDFDGDGDEDLFMTHLTRESNTLYVNDGGALFHDRTRETALANPSWTYTGFGTAWFDYDNDGWLDLLAVNGAIYVLLDLVREGDPFPLHQTNQLFRNLGNGTFAEVTRDAGEVFELSEVSRGALFGDVDNDGDTDVVVTNNSGPARLLINEVGNRKPWLGLRLVGQKTPRDMVGAKLFVHRAGKPPLLRRVRTDGSYASANDPRVLVGLGEDPAVTRVEVVWPDGQVEWWNGLPLGMYIALTQGSGIPGKPGKPEP